MKRAISITIIILAVAPLLWGCSQSKAGISDSTRGEFTAILSGRTENMDFSATLTASPVNEDGSRSFSLTLTSPENLCGLRVTSDGQIVIISLGEANVYSGTLDALPTVSAMIESFAPAEPPISISAVDGKRAGLTEYSTVTELCFPSFRIYTDPKSDIPIMIKALPQGEDFNLIFTIDSFS